MLILTTTTSLDPSSSGHASSPAPRGFGGAGREAGGAGGAQEAARCCAYMLLAVALQEQEVRGLVEGVPHAAAAAAAAPRRRRAAGQGGAVPLEPGPAAGPGPAPCPPRRGPQAGLAEAAPQGRGGPAPLSARRPPGPPRPVPLQLPRLGVDACGDGGETERRSAPAAPHGSTPAPPQHPACCWRDAAARSGDAAAGALPALRTHPALVSPGPLPSPRGDAEIPARSLVP